MTYSVLFRPKCEKMEMVYFFLESLTDVINIFEDLVCILFAHRWHKRDVFCYNLELVEDITVTPSSIKGFYSEETSAEDPEVILMLMLGRFGTLFYNHLISATGRHFG